MEYNRVASTGELKAKKQVERLLDPPGRKRSVFPDLIVHNRSGSSAEHNLLVAEAKRTPADSEEMSFDLRKLVAYRDQLGYCCAVYIELGKDPRWQWIGVNKETVPVGDFVFQA